MYINEHMKSENSVIISKCGDVYKIEYMSDEMLFKKSDIESLIKEGRVEDISKCIGNVLILEQING